MAKKRKLSTKSTDATTTSTQQHPKKIQKKNQQQQQEEENEQQQQEEENEQQQQEEENEQQQQEEEEAKEQQLQQQQQEEVNQEEEEEVEEEEEEIEEIEEEFEVEGDEGDEEQEDEEETKPNDVVVEEEGDDEPISNLLEPFTKDQLIMILREAAETHPDVASRIRNVADEDTVHRKIFVHGLGWDTTEDTLRSAFSQYGEIEDCKAVMDKISGKSKGYGFILFKTRVGARKALEVPMKKIGNRMTSCQLSATGSVPAPGGGGGVAQPVGPVSEYTQRKIYVSNVSADIDPQKLMAFFAKFGEIEDGPLGLDKQTGKPKGFCLFVYRTVESAKKALAEPHKHFEGHLLHCKKAVDGPKPGKNLQMGGQSRGKHYGGRGDKAGAMGGGPSVGAGLMGQLVGAPAAPAGGLNPALGQALTALLASQGAGLGLNNLLGTLGGGVAGGGAAAHGAYGAQSVGYGAQGGLQSAYPNQQMGQGGSGRSTHGMGGVPPYGGR